MATIKIKFKQSTSITNTKQGTIYYQVIHNRISRQYTTNYILNSDEFDEIISERIFSENNNRRNYLLEISKRVKSEIKLFNKVITILNEKNIDYTADAVIANFLEIYQNNYFFSFMENIISNLRRLDRIRIAEIYTTTLNSFKKYRNYTDLPLEELDSDIILSYEQYLREREINPNTSSFYMRNLRAVYNRAVERGLTSQKFPFKQVYTGIGKTKKRAISLVEIKKIKNLNLPKKSSLDFARDIFIFSFMTRGMSFIDIAYLKKKNLSNGVLKYRRKKTGQEILIKWERCMQEVVNKWTDWDSPYLFPIIKIDSYRNDRIQYIYAAHNINRNLKLLGERLLLKNLTFYVARHSWANIAQSKNIPLSIISEGMGHNSEKTTRIYLASLDTNIIDKANQIILKSL